MKLAHFLLPLGVLLFLLSMGNAQPTAPVSKPVAVEPAEISTGFDQELRVKVGPPEATLAVWVLEPPAGTPIRGTVIFLHGFLGRHRDVQNAAEALRENHYRSVLVDLRGWGESTGKQYTFGVLDAHDLSQLVDGLQARKLCRKTLGVYGTSMGASIAILFAAADARVTTLVAVAPFADIREEVPSFGRNIFGSYGSYFSDSILNSIANTIGDYSHMDLDDAKPIDAITKIKIPILLIHGDEDTIIPHTASEKLHAAAPGYTELTTMRGSGHLDLCFDLGGKLQGMTRSWFDKHLMPH